jgi:hypothetical protein
VSSGLRRGPSGNGGEQLRRGGAARARRRGAPRRGSPRAGGARHSAAPGWSPHGAVAKLRGALRSLAGFCNDKIAQCRLPRPGGVRRTDRSCVGCSHREGCPLFPLLKASLRGWRDYYCDSADRWHECARYKLSLTGRLVPITLLPNGHDAQLLRPDPDAVRPGAAEPRHAPSQAPPSQLNSGSPETAVPIARFEPGPTPARPLEPSPPSQVSPPPVSPPAVSQPPANPPARLTRPARRAYGSMRRWWTRLADWMARPV